MEVKNYQAWAESKWNSWTPEMQDAMRKQITKADREFHGERVNLCREKNNSPMAETT